ncbi:hypothetical protein HELRODRAFT_182608 [Helobdella robusta]|uniref:Uncharacterized protein n=1 Tax=Helobdella robusta TaxID=6412 RepID=T1FIG9_HELRO|nr:hypothetical protein HELRODRAFT_182608 [Helobdella robusta]ESN90781.1 hypothetical protein HELRODRAFT_182608 [Helobdella robusta]
MKTIKTAGGIRTLLVGVFNLENVSCRLIVKPRRVYPMNPRPVFTGPVCQSVGFRTTLACFHWAVKSDRLSHDQGPVFTGPVCQSVGFRTTLACFHWAVESDRLSHDQGPVFTGPSSLIGFRTTKGLFSLGLSVSRSAFAQPWPVFTGPSSLIGFRTTNTRQQEWVLRSALNFASDGEVVRKVGREFQRKGPEKAKADLAKECLTRVKKKREEEDDRKPGRLGSINISDKYLGNNLD